MFVCLMFEHKYISFEIFLFIYIFQGLQRNIWILFKYGLSSPLTTDNENKDFTNSYKFACQCNLARQR